MVTLHREGEQLDPRFSPYLSQGFACRLRVSTVSESSAVITLLLFPRSLATIQEICCDALPGVVIRWAEGVDMLPADILPVDSQLGMGALPLLETHPLDNPKDVLLPRGEEVVSELCGLFRAAGNPPCWSWTEIEEWLGPAELTIPHRYGLVDRTTLRVEDAEHIWADISLPSPREPGNIPAPPALSVHKYEGESHVAACIIDNEACGWEDLPREILLNLGRSISGHSPSILGGSFSLCTIRSCSAGSAGTPP